MQKTFFNVKLIDIISQIIDKLTAKSTSKDSKSSFDSILEELLKTDAKANIDTKYILNSLEELASNPKELKKNNLKPQINLTKDDIIYLLSLIQNFSSINLKNKENQHSKIDYTIYNDVLQNLSKPAIDPKYSPQTDKENLTQKIAQASSSSELNQQQDKIDTQTETKQKLTISNSKIVKLLDSKTLKINSNELTTQLQAKTKETAQDQKENTSLKKILLSKIKATNESQNSKDIKENTPNIKTDITEPNKTSNNQTKTDSSYLKIVHDSLRKNQDLLSKLNSKFNQNHTTKNIFQTDTQSKSDNNSSKQAQESTENRFALKDQPKIIFQNNASDTQIKDSASSTSQNDAKSENSQSNQNQPQEQSQVKFAIDNKTLKNLFINQNHQNNQTQEPQQKIPIENKNINLIKPQMLNNSQNQTQSPFNLSVIPNLQKTQDASNTNTSNQTYPINHIVEKIIELQNIKPPAIKTIQIQLNPPSLGKVDVKVSIDTSKTLSASIHVDNQEVFNLLNNNLDTLKTSISQQGINISQISITTSNLAQQNFNQNQNQQNQNQAFFQFNQGFSQSNNSQNSFNQAFNQQKQQSYVFENNTKQIKRIFKKTNALLDISI